MILPNYVMSQNNEMNKHLVNSNLYLKTSFLILY